MKRLLLVLAACGSSPPPAPAHHATATKAEVERGLDFERGRGVPRDYRKAVDVYRAACHDGCGELASCERLFRLASEERGVQPDARAVGEFLRLARQQCDKEHDQQMCDELAKQTALPRCQ